MNLWIPYEKVLPKPSVSFSVSSFFHHILNLNVEYQTKQFDYPLFNCMTLACPGGCDLLGVFVVFFDWYSSNSMRHVFFSFAKEKKTKTKNGILAISFNFTPDRRDGVQVECSSCVR